MTRVLVCGGRRFGRLPKQFVPSERERLLRKAAAERAFLDATLTLFHAQRGFTLLIQGEEERGADFLAKEWAKNARIAFVGYPANWYPRGQHGGMDRGAGPKRNSFMLANSRPDLGICFAGGKGTKDMRDKLLAAGIEVIEPVMAEVA